jgi:hypothetical protein
VVAAAEVAAVEAAAVVGASSKLGCSAFHNAAVYLITEIAKIVEVD